MKKHGKATNKTKIIRQKTVPGAGGGARRAAGRGADLLAMIYKKLKN